jgi:hypothetical protein
VALININPPPGTIVGSYVQSFVNLDAAAGTVTTAFSAVPNGEVWVIEAASIWDATTDITSVKIRKNSGGAAYVVGVKNPAGTSDSCQIQCPVTLFPAEFLDFEWQGVVLHDDIFAHAVGVKFAIELF